MGECSHHVIVTSVCKLTMYKCFTAITTTCVGEKYKVRVGWSVNWYFSLLKKKCDERSYRISNLYTKNTGISLTLTFSFLFSFALRASMRAFRRARAASA